MNAGPPASLIDRAVTAVAAAALTALLVTVMLGVITRALGSPLIWTDEGSRMLMAWLAGFGWIIALRRRVHIRIRFFHDLLPPPLWRAAEVVMQLAVCAFGLLLVRFGTDLVRRNLDVDATSLPVPIAVSYVPIVLVGLATAWQGLLQAGEAAGLLPGPDRRA